MTDMRQTQVSVNTCQSNKHAASQPHVVNTNSCTTCDRHKSVSTPVNQTNTLRLNLTSLTQTAARHATDTSQCQHLSNKHAAPQPHVVNTNSCTTCDRHKSVSTPVNQTNTLRLNLTSLTQTAV